MAITLRQPDPDFESRFSAFLATKREVSADVDAAVRDIIAAVRRPPANRPPSPRSSRSLLVI